MKTFYFNHDGISTSGITDNAAYELYLYIKAEYFKALAEIKEIVDAEEALKDEPLIGIDLEDKYFERLASVGYAQEDDFDNKVGTMETPSYIMIYKGVDEFNQEEDNEQKTIQRFKVSIIER